MSINGNNKKSEQLGMPHGTAAAMLRKAIMFNLLKRLNENYCFQCGEEIRSTNELSIEHKKAWLDSENPIALFYDLENIAFSHLKCNAGAARNVKAGQMTEHGTLNRYRYHGCRCELCRAANASDSKRWKNKRKMTR